MNVLNVKNLYFVFFDFSHWKKRETEQMKTKTYQHAQELWKIVKYDQTFYEKKVNELKVKTKNSKGSIMSFWGNALLPPSKKKKDIHPAPSSSNKIQSSPNATTTQPERIDLSKPSFVKIYKPFLSRDFIEFNRIVNQTTLFD